MVQINAQKAPHVQEAEITKMFFLFFLNKQKRGVLRWLTTKMEITRKNSKIHDKLEEKSSE